MMNAVESATNVAGMARAALGYREPRRAFGAREEAPDSDVVPGEGALAKARGAVRQVMARLGFIDIAGNTMDNFKILREAPARGTEVEHLEPGALGSFTAWIAGEIAAQADQATEAQARVRPAAAIKLLTRSSPRAGATISPNGRS